MLKQKRSIQFKIIKKNLAFKPNSFKIDYYFFLFLRDEISIIPPKTSIRIPDQILTLILKEGLYMSGLDKVNNPKRSNTIPNIANIKPIGNFISSIIKSFNYQNITVKTETRIKIKIANTEGRLYHATSTSTTFGVN